VRRRESRRFSTNSKCSGSLKGQNLIVVAGGFDLRGPQFVEYARTLVKSAPDVIVSAGEAATRAAKEATLTIPIIGQSSDMVAAGLVPSFAHPGGNITGISIQNELDGKRQEKLIEAVPGARRIGMWRTRRLHNPRILKCLKTPHVLMALKQRSLLRLRRPRSFQQWRKPRHQEPMHLTCSVDQSSLSIAASSSKGGSPTPACDLRMGGYGPTRRLDWIRTKPPADLAAVSTLGCQGFSRRQARGHSRGATYQF
jgi:hypothetical protein